MRIARLLGNKPARNPEAFDGARSSFRNQRILSLTTAVCIKVKPCAAPGIISAETLGATRFRRRTAFRQSKMTSFSPARNNAGGPQASPFGIGQNWRNRNLVPPDTPHVQRQLLDHRIKRVRIRSSRQAGLGSGSLAQTLKKALLRNAGHANNAGKRSFGQGCDPCTGTGIARGCPSLIIMWWRPSIRLRRKPRR
jgi:hypothetical protein